MRTTRIVIVGAGLAGLYAAFLLEKSGIRDYLLLEARDRLGGRIESASASGTSPETVDHFDLGPTWFWPGFQHRLGCLVEELGLERFAQFETGDMLMERSPDEPPTRLQGFANSPPSMRLIGGMGALADALHRRLDTARILTGQRVHHLRATASHIELGSEDASGRTMTQRAERVLLAVPPRLAEDSITFSPSLPRALARQWRGTPTWMAPHAKYIALYDQPFWREQGLSGEARSALGPLGEIHDASVPGGHAALFGFLGMPAQTRKSIPDDRLRLHCRVQMARLFGPRAATPAVDFIKDWAQDSCTATAADRQPAAQHAAAPTATAATGPWHERLTGIASEWSPGFPGYLAGAVEAADLGVQALPEFRRHVDARSASPVSSRRRS